MSNAVIKLVINMVTSFLHIRSITKWLNIYRLNNPLIAKMKVNKKSRNNHNIPVQWTLSNKMKHHATQTRKTPIDLSLITIAEQVTQ